MRKESTSNIRIENTIIFLFIAWLVWSIFFAEHIPAGNGLGWDGALYASLAQHFPTLVFGHQLSEYSTQRVLPSGIIYYVAKLFHASLTDQNMPIAFGIYNTIILGAGVLLWKAIATKQKWSTQARLISFAGLFLNYAVLKMNTYYAVLTDISALICGLLMLYFYISNKNYRVLFSGMIGAFIFPTLLYMGLLLFIFPKKMDANSSIDNKINSKVNRWLSFTVAAFIATLALVFNYTVIGKDGCALGRCLWAPVFCVSVLTLFGYLFLGFRPIFSNYLQLIYKLRYSFHLRILLAFFVLAGMKILLHFISNGQPGALTLQLFLDVLLVRALAYPFIFLISHVLYYGPIVCLLLCFWKETTNYFKNNGFGLLAVMTFYVILSIDSEARQIINFLPIAVFAISEIVNQKILSRYFTTFFVVLSLLISRFWMPLNHGEWPSLMTNPPQVTLEFPMQWYFMSQGPWMSNTMYVVFSTITVLTFFGVYIALRVSHLAKHPLKKYFGCWAGNDIKNCTNLVTETRGKF